MNCANSCQSMIYITAPTLNVSLHFLLKFEERELCGDCGRLIKSRYAYCLSVCLQALNSKKCSKCKIGVNCANFPAGYKKVTGEAHQTSKTWSKRRISGLCDCYPIYCRRLRCKAAGRTAAYHVTTRRRHRDKLGIAYLQKVL